MTEAKVVKQWECLAGGFGQCKEDWAEIPPDSNPRSRYSRVLAELNGNWLWCYFDSVDYVYLRSNKTGTVRGSIEYLFHWFQTYRSKRTAMKHIIGE